MAFGPVMLVWFATLAALGLMSIVQRPEVLAAVNPAYGIRFLVENGWNGFVILGVVFLVVTGGEALYADMGHFGRLPIRLVWFCLVLPRCCSTISARAPWYCSTPTRRRNRFFTWRPTGRFTR